jgi:beta-galactosidase
LDVTQDIQFPVIIRNGTNSKGKKIHYFLNYSGEPQNFKYHFNKGTELVTCKQILHQQELKIASWDMLIIEE